MNNPPPCLRIQTSLMSAGKCNSRGSRTDCAAPLRTMDARSSTLRDLVPATPFKVTALIFPISYALPHMSLQRDPASTVRVQAQGLASEHGGAEVRHAECNQHARKSSRIDSGWRLLWPFRSVSQPASSSFLEAFPATELPPCPGRMFEESPYRLCARRCQS